MCLCAKLYDFWVNLQNCDLIWIKVIQLKNMTFCFWYEKMYLHPFFVYSVQKDCNRVLVWLAKDGICKMYWHQSKKYLLKKKKWEQNQTNQSNLILWTWQFSNHYLTYVRCKVSNIYKIQYVTYLTYVTCIDIMVYI